MTQANETKTPRRRHESVVSDKQGESQQAKGATNKKEGKGSGKQTQSIKYVKLEKERPSLTRDGAKPEPQKSKRKRGSGSRAKAKTGQKLKVIPLGGLDAIGKNMTVFECGNDMVLDDAGLMFPDDDHPGIDLILPDYTYVLEHAAKLKGIVITHGHEDHTGSLPYLFKDLDNPVPIYGTKMTLGLIEGKFKEHRIKNAELIEIKPGDKIKLGCIEAEFFAVNHSIPGSVGVFFRSLAGNVLHTGDFKLDQTPIDGVITDFVALARFGQEGVDLMLCDSTNANIPGVSASEGDIPATFNRWVASARQRVIIASFASND